ncbi:MAG: hypothetical protein WCH99_11280 [Verrucomicrobiota bacterium]
MNKKIIQLNKALAILNKLAVELNAFSSDVPTKPQAEAVQKFCECALMLDPAKNVSCLELWQLYQIYASLGQVPRIKRAEFLSNLPDAMKVVWAIHKSHDVMRDGKAHRGFSGVIGLVAEDSPPGADLAEVDPVTDDQGAGEPPPGA